MSEVQAFFSMGGYAAFVWPAYFLSALVLAGLVWISLRGLVRERKKLAELEARGVGRRRRAVVLTTDETT